MTQVTVAEIRAMNDPEDIGALIDEIRSAISIIEAQLEWRDTEDAEWEARAIGALGFHRVALGEALRRERKITGKTADNQKAAAEQRLAKALRKEAAVSNRSLDLGERKLREYKRRSDMHERALNLIESTNVDIAFRRIARSMLDDGTYESIVTAASRQVRGAIKQVAAQINEPVEAEAV